jgi:O-antigen/teichoic acid export membrane protein
VLILARELSKSSFGEFILVYTGLQIILSFQGAIVTQPHNVLAVHYENDEYKTYTSTALYEQVVLCVVTFLICSAVAAGLSFWTSSAARLVLLLAVAAPVWQAQEFSRRVMYTEVRPRGAILNDLASYGGQAVVILTLILTDNLSGDSAILAIAATSTLAAILGVIQIRDSLNWRFERRYLVQSWRHSQWLVGATASSLAGNNAYIYMVAVFGGASASATLAAVIVILRPVGVLITVLQTMIPTYLARHYSARGDLLSTRIWWPILAVGPIILAYAILVSFIGTRLMDLLYNGQYGEQTILVMLISFHFILQYIGTLSGSTLRVINATSVMFVGSLASSIVTLTAGWLLIGTLSVEGAAVGMILNLLISLTISTRRVRQEFRAWGTAHP